MRTYLLPAALASAAFCTPLHLTPALTTYGNPNAAMYQTMGDPRFSGVAHLKIESPEGVIGCTGALLSSGIHVLTAAHCLSDSSGMPHVLDLSATFYPAGGSGPETIGFAEVIPSPDFTGALREGNDIGLVVLNRVPSAAVTRYGIYDGDAEIGSEYEVAGFGSFGMGATGFEADGQRRRGWNTFDATMTETFAEFPGWTGGDGVLISDFDDGLAANDALGVFYDIEGLGLGDREASMAPGDSGAPAFVAGRIAGVASFRLRLQFTDGTTSDADDISNASFGEFNAFTRVSSHTGWLQPVPEPGTTIVFFALLGFASLRRLMLRQVREDSDRNRASARH